MRNWVVDNMMNQRLLWMVSLAVSLGWSNNAFSQAAPEKSEQKKPASKEAKDQKPAAKTESPIPTLEEMLTRAMKENPDVRVAEAKLREAEAELNRTRLQVTQKVIAYQRSLEAHKEMVQIAEKELKQLQTQFSQSADPNVRQQLVTENESTQKELVRAKAKLAEIEAEMPYLLGNQPKTVHENLLWNYALFPNSNNALYGQYYISNTDPYRDLSNIYLAVQQPTQVPPSAPGSITDKIRKALDMPIAFKMENARLSEVVDFVNEMAPGANFQIAKSSDIAEMKVDLHFREKIP